MLHTAASTGLQGEHWQTLALKHLRHQLQGPHGVTGIVCWKLPGGISSQCSLTRALFSSHSCIQAVLKPLNKSLKPLTKSGCLLPRMDIAHFALSKE